MIRSAAAALTALAALAGCGGGSDSLTVYAAASLTEVFQELDPDARFNLAGSDELAAQIEDGGRADVYAAASPRYLRELFEQGLIQKPRIFATNRLVLIVPEDNPAAIESVSDLARDGVKLVVGAEGVPVGDYTRTVLENMGDAEEERQLAGIAEDFHNECKIFVEADMRFVDRGSDGNVLGLQRYSHDKSRRQKRRPFYPERLHRTVQH